MIVFPLVWDNQIVELQILVVGRRLIGEAVVVVVVMIFVFLGVHLVLSGYCRFESSREVVSSCCVGMRFRIEFAHHPQWGVVVAVP